MTKAVWVKLVFYMFLLAAVAGIYMEFGLGVALIIGGVAGAVCALTLEDVDGERKDDT